MRTVVIIFLLLIFVVLFGCSSRIQSDDSGSTQSNESGGGYYAPPKPPTQYQSDPNSAVYGVLTNGQITALRDNICGKVQPTNSGIRNQAVSIASDASGAWNVNQLVELYIWMKSNIAYVNDPVNQEYFASASETLTSGGGDCEDQAILIASLIQSVGGTSKVVVAPDCGHAFASVYIGDSKEYFDEIQQSIVQIYWNKGIYDLYGESLFGYSDSEGHYWLNVDPAGGAYLGDTYISCRSNASFYPLNCEGVVSTNESRTDYIIEDKDYVSEEGSKVPKLDVQITSCDSSTNILQGLGEVTDVYVSVRNFGSADAHNVVLVAHASDEDQAFKNTANFDVLKIGQIGTVKLTLDTQRNLSTLVTLEVTSSEGAGAEIQRDCS